MIKNNFTDTIASISTPIGRSGIGIIRVSGSLVTFLIKKFFIKIPKPRYANYSKCIIKNKVIDTGILIYFKKPNSYTGEDILEFHGHGNPILLEEILNNIIKFKNIRISNPGEFTKRAFINKKIDLSQAEGINNLINANTIELINLSNRTIEGSMAKEINNINNCIKKIKTLIELNLNFSDEYIKIENKLIDDNLNILIKDLNKLFIDSKLSYNFSKEFNILIIGEPNVGKSSLFNKLINKNKSIITNISGTTRDLIDCDFIHKGINFKITDTAGFTNTKSLVEYIGIKKSIKRIKNSDYILILLENNIDLNNINKLKEIKFFLRFLRKNINLYLFKIIKNIIKFNKFVFLFNKSDKKKYHKNYYSKVFYVNNKNNKICIPIIFSSYKFKYSVSGG